MEIFKLDKFAAPTILVILWNVVLVLGTILSFIAAYIYGEGSALRGFAVLIACIIYILIIRVGFEFYIILFKIHEKMGNLRFKK